MILNEDMICNVCALRAGEDENAVFIRAHKNLKPIDICTSCIPSVIHGSGIVVKSDDELIKDLD